MSFSEIIGHEAQIARIRNAVRSGQIPHAYLFCGPEGVGKKQVAYQLLTYLNCQNQDQENVEACGICPSCLRMAAHNQPDLYEIGGEGETIKIEEVRKISALLSLKNMISRYKCVIIDYCELMTTEAANSLLKVMEEPGEATLFFLITGNEEQILPTIRSRAQKLYFQELSPTDMDTLAKRHDIRGEHLPFLLECARGSFGRLQAMAEDQQLMEEIAQYREILSGLEKTPGFRILYQARIFDKDRKKCQNFLEYYVFMLEKSLREIQPGFPDLPHETRKAIIQEIAEAYKMLDRNISPRFVAEMLLLNTKLLLKG